MAARDYKHAAPRGNGREATQPRYGSWVSFVSGLGFGLVVAFGVYLWSASLPPPGEVVGEVMTPHASETPVDPPVAGADGAIEPPFEPPRPKFDFYKILPEMEVPVQEWELSAEASQKTDKPLDDGAYILQVGSFKRFEDADRAKASLALHGISANVQRVVINGQDVWFRVHIGPLSDVETLRAMRMKLAELDMNFILLKIGGTTAQ